MSRKPAASSPASGGSAAAVSPAAARRRAPPAAARPPGPPRVGERLGPLRQAQGWSLDELSRQAGVSKSMLSQIERNQANPTVAVVWRLASALGVGVGELLGDADAGAPPALQVVPVHATPSLRSTDGRCELRILGPIELAGQFEWYELQMQPGGALESEAHEPGSREHLSVLEGVIEVEVAGAGSRLAAGETARYAVDRPHAIRNRGRTRASALLVVLHAAS